MRGVMITLLTDGQHRTRQFDRRPTLEELQAEVDGPIQAPPFFDNLEMKGQRYHAVVYCNEEGKIRDLPVNPLATIAWLEAAMNHGHMIDDLLCGDVVILLGDKEFLHDSD